MSAWSGVWSRDPGVGSDAQLPPTSTGRRAVSATAARARARLRVRVAALPEQAFHLRLVFLVVGREHAQRQARRVEHHGGAQRALLGQPALADPLEVVPARRQKK